jgi:hypothetical protein
MTKTRTKSSTVRPRNRRHAQLEVSGFHEADPSLPRWERELLRAAFSRLAATNQHQADRGSEVKHAEAL